MARHCGGGPAGAGWARLSQAAGGGLGLWLAAQTDDGAASAAQGKYGVYQAYAIGCKNQVTAMVVRGAQRQIGTLGPGQIHGKDILSGVDYGQQGAVFIVTPESNHATADRAAGKVAPGQHVMPAAVMS